MRKAIHTRIIFRNIARHNKLLFTMLFSTILIFSIGITVQGAQMEIDAPSEVYSEETFQVSIYDPDITTGSPYLNEVTINFNGAQYEIDADSDSVSIQAPSVTKDTEYTISASKTGYPNVETTITVSKKLSLIVIPEKQTVKENERFAVKVTDSEGNKISGATVTIQNYGSTETTDPDGYVWLRAPEDREKIKVIATKNGYEQGSSTIGVNTNPSIIQQILQSPYTPVFIAVALLILAIIVVNIRQKRSIDYRAKEITNEKVLNKYSPSPHGVIIPSPADEKEEIRGQTGMSKKPGPKVEEIRISRPRKDKEIFSINREKREEKRKVMPVQTRQKSESDWFEGKDDLKYEIDKMTGEIDEEELDKWFEGTKDIQDKINERVKKKKKKEQEGN